MIRQNRCSRWPESVFKIDRRAQCGQHIRITLGIRVLSPIELWEALGPWAALFL